MNITLAPIGSLGDIRPIIALRLRLRKKGDTVFFCTSPNFKKLISYYGFQFHTAGIDVQTLLLSNSSKFADKLRELKFAIKTMNDMVLMQFTHLLDGAKEFGSAHRFRKFGLSSRTISHRTLTGPKLASAIAAAMMDASIKKHCQAMQRTITQRDGLNGFMEQLETFCLKK